MAKRNYPTMGVLLAAFAFYLYTLSPSLNWADGARMQLDVRLGGSTYWFFDEFRAVPTDGLPFDRLGAAAWDHPLYVMLGQLFLSLPWGDPAFRINLISAVAGAAAIALMYELGGFLLSNRWAAACGASALAVSHTFWFHAVTSEVYTLNIAFMLALIWLAVRWPVYGRWSELAGFAFLAGLGLSNHLILGLTIVFAVVYMMAAPPLSADGESDSLRLLSARRYDGLAEAMRGWQGIFLALLFVAGFAPWWIQFLRMARYTGLPLAFEVAIGFPWLGHRWGIQSEWIVFTNLARYAGWLLYQFTPIGVALGLYGFWRLRRKPLRERPYLAVFLAALFAGHVAFSANYSLHDQFNFHLPSYTAFALAIPWGCAGLAQHLEVRGARRRHGLATGWRGALLATLILTPIGLYATTPAGFRYLGLTEARLGIQPIGTGARDTLMYFLNPDKRGDTSAMHFGRTTLVQLAPQALVFTPKPTDQEAYVVLRYLQMAEGLRPDVRLELMLFDPGDDMSQAVLAQALNQMGCRPLYLASLNPDSIPLAKLQGDFDIVPEANLYRLRPHRLPATTACPALDEGWAGVGLEELLRRAMRWK